MRQNLLTFLMFSVFMTWPSNAFTNEQVTSDEVVVYTGVDQVFSEPVLDEFEKRFGIKVKAVYDVEAVKTTGLVNRLIAENKRPQCDVFWNNEIVRTLHLKGKGILAPYFSPSAKDIPQQYRDSEGHWTGFAARARVFVVNTDLMAEEDYPKVIDDLWSARWFGKAALANPLFGTTASHMASIFTSRGNDAARELLTRIYENFTQIVDGNSVVRDMVGSGESYFGLTDNDDVAMGRRAGLPIKMVLPRPGSDTVLLIPNTVSLVSGSPHPEAAKKLIDYLLSVQVEQQLIDSEFAMLPLHKNLNEQSNNLEIDSLLNHPVDYEKLAASLDEAMQASQQILMK